MQDSYIPEYFFQFFSDFKVNQLFINLNAVAENVKENKGIL